jgi:hypothetical protein
VVLVCTFHILNVRFNLKNLVDHLHRYEVVELGRPYNQIDPNLSLNKLKKKRQNVLVSPSVTNSKSSTTTKIKIRFKSSSKPTYDELPLCWQWNQPVNLKVAILSTSVTFQVVVAHIQHLSMTFDPAPKLSQSQFNCI